MANDKKDLIYVSKKTKEKVHKVVKRPGKPFTLRDHVMTLKTEKMLLKKEHTMKHFMMAGMVFLAVGLVIIFAFKEQIYEIIGWAIIIIGFLEILESYHRMERWKKGFKKK